MAEGQPHGDPAFRVYGEGRPYLWLLHSGDGPTRQENSFAGLPTIFTVLGKLGLELKRQEDILPVYTVERIERPAAN